MKRPVKKSKRLKDVERSQRKCDLYHRTAKKNVKAGKLRPYWFFAHVAFAIDSGDHTAPQATVNVLIEVDEATLKSAAMKKDFTGLTRAQRTELAAEVAMDAADRYLKSLPEFRQFPAQRFVEFGLIQPQSYISVAPRAAKILRNGAKVWRVEQIEADKLRGEPFSVRYPHIEKRLAAHPFLKGMSRHHIELLALCATPTNFDPGQVIFFKGDPANGFYLIETGSVVLEGITGDGAPVVVDTVSPGEPLGWSWLFPPYLWRFNARAIGSCRAICLSGILLRQHRDDDPSLSHDLFTRVSEVAVRRLQAIRNKLISGETQYLKNVSNIETHLVL